MPTIDSSMIQGTIGESGLGSNRKQGIRIPETGNVRLQGGATPRGLDVNGIRGVETTVKEPTLVARMIQARTLETPKQKVPLLRPEVVQAGLDHILDNAVRYADKQSELEANDALLRATKDADDLYLKVDEEGKSSGFKTLSGKDAATGYSEYESAIKSVFEKYTPESDAAKQKYLTKSFQYIERSRKAGADHAVKQQQVYQEGQNFVEFQRLISNANTYGAESVFSSGPNGEPPQFEQALRNYSNPEEEHKAREEAYKNIMEAELAKQRGMSPADFLNGVQSVASLNDKYRMFNTPQGNSVVMTKLDNLARAAVSQAKHEEREQAAENRARMKFEIPRVISAAVEEGKVQDVLVALDAVQRSSKDPNEGMSMAGDIMANVIQERVHVDGKPVSLVAQEFGTIRERAEVVGKPLDPYIIKKTLSEIDKQYARERTAQKLAKAGNYETLMLEAEKAGKDGRPSTEVLQKGLSEADLSAAQRERIMSRIDRQRKTIAKEEDKSITAEQNKALEDIIKDLNLNNTKGLSRAEFQDKIDDLESKGVLKEGATQFITLMREYDKALKDEMGVTDPAFSAVKKEIQIMAKNMEFSTGNKKNQKNAEENSRKANELVEQMTRWRKDPNNRGKDPKEQLDKLLEPMKGTSYINKLMDMFDLPEVAKPKFTKPVPGTAAAPAQAPAPAPQQEVRQPQPMSPETANRAKLPVVEGKTEKDVKSAIQKMSKEERMAMAKGNYAKLNELLGVNKNAD